MKETSDKNLRNFLYYINHKGIQNGGTLTFNNLRCIIKNSTNIIFDDSITIDFEDKVSSSLLILVIDNDEIKKILGKVYLWPTKYEFICTENILSFKADEKIVNIYS